MQASDIGTYCGMIYYGITHLDTKQNGRIKKTPAKHLKVKNPK